MSTRTTSHARTAKRRPSLPAAKRKTAAVTPKPRPGLSNAEMGMAFDNVAAAERNVVNLWMQAEDSAVGGQKIDVNMLRATAAVVLAHLRSAHRVLNLAEFSTRQEAPAT